MNKFASMAEQHRYNALMDARVESMIILRQPRFGFPTESKKKLRQFGLWAYVRYCRNKGIDFIDCYVSIFNKMPRI